jgi:outer membrane biosynthesis protein TonB
MPTSEAKPTANEPDNVAAPRPRRASTGPLNLSYPEDDRPWEDGVSEDEATLIDESTTTDSNGSRRRISRGASTSRWVDYDTHELLTMISELEDERRWARLREGIWIALLFHIALLLAAILLPKYVFMPRVIDPFDAIKQRKDLAYLDLPPDVIRKLQAKPKVEPLPAQRQPRVDKKTLEALKKSAPPPPKPEPTPEPATPQPNPALATPAPKVEPAPAQPSEAPRPQAVPRPSFAMGSTNPADQLRDAMRGARSGPGSSSVPGGPGQMPMHPGAGSGGVQVLSDTQGVDFSSWLLRWHRETQRTWDPLIPDEVNPPIYKKGAVVVRFKVLPNGRIMEGSMALEGRSGDTGLDRAAWGALTGSNYPPLPREFHGPYLELRAIFLYNMEPGKE